MLKWDIQNNVINKLYYKNKNLINPWGIETADSWSFFSMEKNIGYRFKELEFDQRKTESTCHTRCTVSAKEGLWRIETVDQIDKNSITRSAKLTCLEDSYFMDFVVRMRFKKEFFDFAEIAGKRIHHERKNIYHQYPVNEAVLVGKDIRVQVKIIESDCAGKFKPHLYVRDHEDEWVVHARMIPIVEDKNVIKLCSRYFSTSPLPAFITKAILKIKKIKSYLWYRGEHTPYRSKIARFFGLNAFPMAGLSKGEELNWSIEINVS